MLTRCTETRPLLHETEDVHPDDGADQRPESTLLSFSLGYGSLLTVLADGCHRTQHGSERVRLLHEVGRE